MTHRDKMQAFAGVLLVLFLASLNTTVVGTALPRIIADLGGMNVYTWAFTAYTLAQTVSIPVYGKLSDLYGRKPVLLFGIALFTLASALGGLSQSMGFLIACRALQGLGGGALMSMAFAAIGDLFTLTERGKYQGLNGAVFGVSSVLGPLLGGFLTDHLSWHWVFFVNVPVAVLAFWFIARFFPAKRERGEARIDVLGALLLTAAVVPLLLALTWGGTTDPWTSPKILGLLAFAAACTAAFVTWQARTPSPILALNLFRNPTFTFANIAGFFSTAGLYAAILYLPLFMQGVRGVSASNSGIVLAPLMLGMIVTSTVAGFIVSRVGRYKPAILAGLVVMTGALFFGTRLTPDTATSVVVGLMIVLGLGLGPTGSLFTLAVQTSSPRAQLGMATSANQFFRNMGGTIGAAVFGAVQANHLHALPTLLASSTRALPSSLAVAVADPNILSNPSALAKLHAAVAPLVGEAGFARILATMRGVLTDAVTNVFLLAGLGMTVALLVTLALPNLNLKSVRPQPETPRAPEVEAKPLAGVGVRER
ncbi:MDR family MFS transporter [Deinococcus yavapaiensis]|uniref:EmrB/QacA subfamily drug resistance transporter n=1 Tax=Deinococcus yavapaiensis KR-236 TaxID=694435 RepID=A0A318S989_9DEIO|nr:MDR family MFS transporter [Deinococcus yavapaiensis]PYE55700.1 EmrB/QacA subfamily drug resistance transporter [Deinococcus yavapaiensis KR-236]